MTAERRIVQRVAMLPHQHRILDAIISQKYRFANLRGGVGCGKTATLAMILYAAHRKWPGVPFLIGSNTMMNLVACVNGMLEFYEKAGLTQRGALSYHLCKTGVDPHLELSIVRDGKRITTKHFLRSLFDVKTLVSFECGGILIDEVMSCKFDGFMAASGRVRLPEAPNFQVTAGTPRGMTEIARKIEEMEEAGMLLNVVKVKTSSNPFTADEFKTDAARKYEGTPFAAQELDGEIISLGELCFPTVHLVDYTPVPTMPYSITVDFGFNYPAIIGLQRDKNGRWTVFHSCLTTKKTITDALHLFMKGLKEKWGITKNPASVTYDPAGRNKSDQTGRAAADDLEAFFHARDPQNEPHYYYSFRKVDRGIETGIQNMIILFEKGKLVVARHEEKRKPGEYTSVYDALRQCEYRKVGPLIDYSEYVKDHRFDDVVDAIRYHVMFSTGYDILDIRGHTHIVDPEVRQEVF